VGGKNTQLKPNRKHPHEKEADRGKGGVFLTKYAHKKKNQEKGGGKGKEDRKIRGVTRV